MPKKNAQLSVIQAQPDDGDHPAPPQELGEIGTRLWVEVTSVYEFTDPGSTMMLLQACLALDRAAACARQIDRDGEMLRGKGGVARANPLLRDELANRAFATRALSKLGLDLEPVRSTIGRPPGR